MAGGGEGDGDDAGAEGGGGGGPGGADAGVEFGDVVLEGEAEGEGWEEGRGEGGGVALSEGGAAVAGGGGEGGRVGRVGFGPEGGGGGDDEVIDRGDAAGEEADGVEGVGVGDHAVAREHAVRGLVANHAGVGGGEADGAAGVCAEGEGGFAGGDGDGAAAGAAAGGEVGVGLRDGAEGGVGRVAAHAKLIEVGLADDDGAALPELGDDGGLKGGGVGGEEGRGACRRERFGGNIVLDGECEGIFWEIRGDFL